MMDNRTRKKVRKVEQVEREGREELPQIRLEE